MDSPDDNEIRRRPSGQLPKRKTVDTISSLDEAWLHTLDRGVGDSPINEVILPLMRDCFFFGGPMHAVLLLQKGHATGSRPILRATLRKSRSCRQNSQQNGDSVKTEPQCWLAVSDAPLVEQNSDGDIAGQPRCLSFSGPQRAVTSVLSE